MRSCVTVLRGVICVLALTGPGLAQNLVVNPDFETGAMSPWAQTYGGTEYTSYTVGGEAHAGSYCVVGTAGEGGESGEQAPVAIEQTNIPLQPNKVYAVSFWYKTNWQNYGIVDVRFATNSGTGLVLNHLTNLAPSYIWTQVTLTYTTGADVISGGLSLSTYQGTTGDKIWLDDFSIAQTEPSLNNTTFENSTWAPWTPGGMHWVLTTSNPHWGSKCARANGGSTNPYEGWLQWKDQPVHPNTEYRFSMWVRNTGSNWGPYGVSYSQSWFKALVQEADSSGNWGALGSHNLTLVESSMTNWTRLVSEFTTSPTTTQVRIALRGHLASTVDTAAFDDIAFTQSKAGNVCWVPLDMPSMQIGVGAGADVTGIPVKGSVLGSGSYYPSTVCTPDPALGDGSLLFSAIQYAHDRGVTLIAGFPPTMDANILSAHPEWRIRYTDSTSWLTSDPNTARGCLVSPYGDFLINQMVELAQKVGVDGVSYDGYQNPDFCYCDYCKAKYLADTGSSIPAAVDYSSAAYRRYLFWLDAQIMDHLTRMKAAVRDVYPAFDFYIWSTNAGRYGHYLTSPRVMPTELHTLFDCSMQEWWADESNIGLSVIPDFGAKYLVAVSRGTRVIQDPYLFTHAQDLNAGVYASSFPDVELQFRILMAIATGSAINFDASTPKRHLTKSIFALNSARREWVNKAQSLPWAALVVSEPTRQFYGRNDAVNLYMNNCFGYYSALTEKHLPVDIITHTDLRNGLAANYKVLILANTACMSTADVTAVRNFVSAGGGLVATGATSLYDENGVARANYALSDLFKASKSGPKTNVQYKVTIGETLFGRNSTELGKLLSPTGRTASFVGEVFPVTVTSGGTSLATVCRTAACSLTYPLYVANANTGAGRVAFLPACIDAGYFRNPYPYEATLLRDAVMWAANSTPPVAVVGPKDLQVTYFAQNGGKRLVVHLLNARISNAGLADPANDVPVRDEVVPIRNIEVWFENATPTSVALQPENLILIPQQQGGRTRVIVNEIEQHSMVVADIP